MQAIATLDDAGNRDGDRTGYGGLSEYGARGCVLRHAIRRECREPGFGVWKLRDQIRSAECRHHDGFSNGEQLIHERALIVGKANVAFAIGDAHEESGNGDIVGSGRRQLERTYVNETRIRAQRLQRVHARANFRLDSFHLDRDRDRPKAQPEERAWDA